MTRYIVINSDNAIIRAGTCQECDVSLQARQGEVAITDVWGASDDTHYWDDENAMAAPKLSLDLFAAPIKADGIDATLIADVPEGVYVTWTDGFREAVTDGVVEFATTQSGSYKLIFDGVKYLRQEVIVEAGI